MVLRRDIEEVCNVLLVGSTCAARQHTTIIPPIMRNHVASHVDCASPSDVRGCARGRNEPGFADPLLDNLVGNWSLTGKIGARDAAHDVTVEWVLHHQFLRIHECDPKQPHALSGPLPYEAMVFVGYDHQEKKYVAHWLDIFGGRFSETLGYGTRVGDSIKFTFDYPDGPFHTNFTWQPAARTWQWHMEQQKAGTWKTFGDMTLTKK